MIQHPPGTEHEMNSGLPQDSHESHGIEFLVEDVPFELAGAEALGSWIEQIIKVHEYELVQLTYIFCSDEYLHRVNMEYLNHDTYTDIITFDNADDADIIEGDIFISVERVRENAEQLKIPFLDELHRVMIHGVLHLLGYADKDLISQTAMRKKEDYCLTLRVLS